MVSTSTEVNISFNIDSSYPKKFPKSLNLSTVEPLSQKTYLSQFKKAKKHHLPYYAVTIVHSIDPYLKSYFQVFDTIFFNNWKCTLQEQKMSLVTPINFHKVEKIYYFALPCFQFDPKNICIPVDLSNSCQFTPFNLKIPEKEEAKKRTYDILEVLLDCVNQHINKSKDANNQQIVDSQFVISDCIRTGELLPELLPEEREKEEIKWLWCASHKSYRAMTALAKKCLQKTGPLQYNKTAAIKLLRVVNNVKLKKMPNLDKLIKNEAHTLFQSLQAPKKELA